MFCCVRTRDRKEGKSADQPAEPPAGQYGYDNKSGKKYVGDGGLKDGNMVVLAGAGAAVVATAVTAAVVVSAQESDRNTGGGGCGVAGVGDTSGGGASQGCCCGGGDGGGGGGCGGCGGCGDCKGHEFDVMTSHEGEMKVKVKMKLRINRKEGKSADELAEPRAGQYGYDKKSGKKYVGDGGFKDGNMVVLAGAGAAVAATAVTAAVVVSDRNTGGGGGGCCGVADVGDTGGGGCWCGGGCGGCGQGSPERPSRNGNGARRSGIPNKTVLPSPTQRTTVTAET
ncbi:PREDICTED: loricrin-like [Erythranthe guttata]|uniref:loricrin-like n=1 Tax=Erythranthe guttata TaxID=4155 RepID=UPI00064DF550|nr:PREDICTED: loricrin-like [Erythranthe guttata]|eukprot:XP_012847144.1 PREDICTED: loricrin-like [Erythranthe guttata]